MTTTTIRESVQAVVDGLAPLTEKLQMPVSHLWEIGIKHSYAVGIESLIEALICVVIIVTFFYYLRRSDDNDKYQLMAIIFGGMSLVALLVLFPLLESTIERLAAPEYGALRDISRLILNKN